MCDTLIYGYVKFGDSRVDSMDFILFLITVMPLATLMTHAYFVMQRQ